MIMFKVEKLFLLHVNIAATESAKRKKIKFKECKLESLENYTLIFTFFEYPEPVAKFVIYYTTTAMLSSSIILEPNMQALMCKSLLLSIAPKEGSDKATMKNQKIICMSRAKYALFSTAKSCNIYFIFLGYASQHWSTLIFHQIS